MIKKIKEQHVFSRLQRYNLFLNDNDFLFYDYNCIPIRQNLFPARARRLQKSQIICSIPVTGDQYPENPESENF